MRVNGSFRLLDLLCKLFLQVACGEEKKVDCLSALAEDECATLESDSCVSERFLLTERSIKHVMTRETEVCFIVSAETDF